MAEIGFYHLLATPLERGLPRLLERGRAQRHNIVVRAGSPERVEHLNALLWTYGDATFLPNGQLQPRYVVFKVVDGKNAKLEALPQ